MVEIVIHGRVPSKKNSKRIIRRKNGKPLIISSKSHKDWHEKAVEDVLASTKEQNLTGSVLIRLYAPDKRSGDLTNKAESIMDLLVDTGVLEDDNWYAISTCILMFCGVDKENPRAEVRIYEPGEKIRGVYA